MVHFGPSNRPECPQKRLQMNNEDKPQEFDMDKAAEELRAVKQPSRGGRKLRLAEQCAAFAALRHGARAAAVASVFNLSETTVSNLAGCIDDDRAPIADLDGGLHDPNLTRGRDPERVQRYRAVAEEFNRLGEAEFKRRYYTPFFHELILAAQSKPRTPRHPPTADRYADDYQGVHEMPIGGVWIFVLWMDDADHAYPKTPGWSWSTCEANGSPTAHTVWTGQELFDPHKKFTPYRTSKAALEGAQKYWARD
jgi:hypothetical protein